MYGGAARPDTAQPRPAGTYGNSDSAPPTQAAMYGGAASSSAPPRPSGTYGSAATPHQTGNAAPPHQAGNAAPPHQAGNAAPPRQAGNAAPPHQAGYAAPPQQVGTAGPPGTYGGSGTAPAPGRKKRRARLVAVLGTALLLLVLLGGGAGVQLTRDLPAATLATTVAATMQIPGKAPSLPWPDQGSAELMVEGLGRLGGSGSDKTAPIGSVAKVMTAYVILRDHPLNGDEEGPTLTVTAADVADYKSRIATNQSQVPVRVGEKLTERDAIEALMLPSANNIAHQLAVWDAGSEKAFVDKMNATADELGMTGTKYSDPSGFLPTTVSTAADQVKLGRAALSMEVFAAIVALPSATIPVAGKIRNYNDLLGVDGVFGIKTGSTDEAGGNLLFSSRLKVGGRTLTVVGAVFNQPGLHTPEQLANVNREVRALLKSVRQTVKQYTLLPADAVGQVETAWGDSSPIRPAKPLQVVGWPGLSVPVEVTTTAPGSTVTAGQAVGSVEASGVRVDLLADAATGEPSLWWKLTRKP